MAATAGNCVGCVGGGGVVGGAVAEPFAAGGYRGPCGVGANFNPASGLTSYAAGVGNERQIVSTAAPGVFPAGTVVRDQCTGETRIYQAVAVPPPRGALCGCGSRACGESCTGAAAVDEFRQPCQVRRRCQETVTQCYKCPPRRADCYPQDPKPYELLYRDQFDKFSVGQSDRDTWNYFQVSKFIANDATTRVLPGGVQLSSVRFSKTYPEGRGPSPAGWLDHYKAWVILNSEFALPECGELYAEITMAAQTYGTAKQPFGSAVADPAGDPRLAYAGFSLIDFEQAYNFAHVMTTGASFVFYERLPFFRNETSSETTQEAAFTGAFQIGQRNYSAPMQDLHPVGIALSKRKGATWWLAGSVVHNIPRIGIMPNQTDLIYKSPGTTQRADINCVSVGFGNFSFLDGMPPESMLRTDTTFQGLAQLISPGDDDCCTTSSYTFPLKPSKELSFVVDEPDVSDRLFGQGAAIMVKDLNVVYRC